MRPRTLDEVVGQEHVLGAGQRRCARAIEQGRPHSMVLYGPPGTGKTTLARIVATAARAAFEELSAVEAGRAEVRAVLERAAHRRQGDRRADDLLPRRDPPLQQGPAGRAAARRRGGPRDPDRRDDREPVLRGQLGAALARPGLRAAARSPRADVEVLLRRALDRGELRRHEVDDDASRSSPGAPAATRARRWRRSSSRARPRADGEPRRRSSAPRTRCSAARSSTTSRATATTTRSRPGSRRRAARTRTRRCTTWR